jgi:hypothetical protein
MSKTQLSPNLPLPILCGGGTGNLIISFKDRIYMRTAGTIFTFGETPPEAKRNTGFVKHPTLRSPVVSACVGGSTLYVLQNGEVWVTTARLSRPSGVRQLVKLPSAIVKGASPVVYGFIGIWNCCHVLTADGRVFDIDSRLSVHADQGDNPVQIDAVELEVYSKLGIVAMYAGFPCILCTKDGEYYGLELGRVTRAYRNNEKIPPLGRWPFDFGGKKVVAKKVVRVRKWRFGRNIMFIAVLLFPIWSCCVFAECEWSKQ